MIDYEKLIAFVQQGNTFHTHNGITVTEVSTGSAKASVCIEDISKNNYGLISGGLIFTICDIVTGVAAASYGRSAVTLSSSMEFLRTTHNPKIYAIGQCIKEGKTIGVFEAKVYDEEHVLLAHGTFQYYYQDHLPFPI